MRPYNADAKVTGVSQHRLTPGSGPKRSQAKA